jgi:hypothetical protein
LHPIGRDFDVGGRHQPAEEDPGLLLREMESEAFMDPAAEGDEGMFMALRFGLGP